MIQGLKSQSTDEIVGLLKGAAASGKIEASSFPPEVVVKKPGQPDTVSKQAERLVTAAIKYTRILQSKKKYNERKTSGRPVREGRLEGLEAWESECIATIIKLAGKPAADKFVAEVN